jgi:hypothetical protein
MTTTILDSPSSGFPLVLGLALLPALEQIVRWADEHLPAGSSERV